MQINLYLQYNTKNYITIPILQRRIPRPKDVFLHIMQENCIASEGQRQGLNRAGSGVCPAGKPSQTNPYEKILGTLLRPKPQKILALSHTLGATVWFPAPSIQTQATGPPCQVSGPKRSTEFLLLPVALRETIFSSHSGSPHMAANSELSTACRSKGLKHMSEPEKGTK